MVSSVWGGLWGVVLLESEVVQIWSKYWRLVQMVMVGVACHGVVLCVLLFVISIRIPRFCGDMEGIFGRKWERKWLRWRPNGPIFASVFSPAKCPQQRYLQKKQFFSARDHISREVVGLGQDNVKAV